MPALLKARRIIVTGGASGFGRAICLRLAKDGAHVIVNCRTRHDEAATLVAEIERSGGSADVISADVTDGAAVRVMLEQQTAQGGIQGLVHAASAPLRDSRFGRTPWDSFEQHWRVAVQGAYNLTQAFIAQPESCSPESIVFILSSGTLGVPPGDKAAYITAKYALLGLARSLAVELAARRIRVNCLSPGFAETPLTAHVDPRVKELIARAVPLKRLAEPEEIAQAVAYLSGPNSGYLTGVNLPIAGGAVM